jgi:Predicted membrane protein
VEIGLGVGHVDETTRERDLRRMKRFATGLLLVATVVFLFARWWEVNDGPTWVGYVRAMAEAGMVGALADWFAVTALFRHPLGIPIPHTAIIPTKKDVLGDSLGDFVGENFLSEAVVRDKLARVEVSSRVGAWIGQKANADRITAELATAARGVVTVLRDEDVQEVIEQVLVRKLMERPIGPPLGTVLQGVLADGAHHRMVDLVCDRAYDWVSANHDMVLRIVHDRAPTWSPRFLDDLVADKVFLEVQNFAWAVKTDPQHPLRKAVDTFLVDFATDLQNDPDTIERADRIKQQIVAHPDVQKFIGQAWGTIKGLILDAAADPSSALRTRVRDGLVTFGARLSSDAELRGKVDGWLAEAAGYVVRHYRGEITTLITDTVARWDAEETSRKVELQVGRDLQFIRINGTVVGALAGLVIFTVGQLAFGG